jgi:protein SCO1/2
MQQWFAGLALLVALNVAVAQSLQRDALPPDSVYNLQVPLEDQSGEMTGLDRYRGSPVLITMFYASCPHVCPMLISTIKLTESKLSEDERADLRVLTISIDPQRDTPEKLRETMDRYSVNRDRWSMVRPKPADLRAIAGVFGIRYRQLPDGEFNHTTRIILLDRDGTQVATTEKLGRHDEAFVQALRTNMESC